jgi:hypothetical protein
LLLFYWCTGVAASAFSAHWSPKRGIALALRGQRSASLERSGVAGGVGKNVGPNDVWLEAGELRNDDDAIGRHHAPGLDGLAPDAQPRHDFGKKAARAQRRQDCFGLHLGVSETLAGIAAIQATHSRRCQATSAKFDLKSFCKHPLPMTTFSYLQFIPTLGLLLKITTTNDGGAAGNERRHHPRPCAR